MATGLGWTSSGGQLLFIEVTKMKGTGRQVVTGSLGDVMKESFSVALSYVRSVAEQVDIDPAQFEETDIHIHIPSGAMPQRRPICRYNHGHRAGQLVYRPSGRPQAGNDRRSDFAR